MAFTIHVDIVSAEAEIFSGRAEMVLAPAAEGEVGIMPQHAPLLTRLAPGEVSVKVPDGPEQLFFVTGGMLEIQPHMVTILADTALRAQDVDEAAAIEAKEAAERAVHDRRSDIDYAKAMAELAQKAAELQAIRRLRKKLGR